LKIVEGFDEAKSILSRRTGEAEVDIDDKEQVVRQIINDVRARGDAALLDYTEKFDGVRLTSLEIDKSRVKQSSREIDTELLSALKLAAERIASFHKTQKDSILRDSTGAGLGWLLRPLTVSMCPVLPPRSPPRS